MTRCAFIAAALLCAGPAAATETCHTYAMTAISQIEEAASLPGCIVGPPPARWDADYNAQRTWCERVGLWDAHVETWARRDAIFACRRRVGYY